MVILPLAHSVFQENICGITMRIVFMRAVLPALELLLTLDLPIQPGQHFASVVRNLFQTALNAQPMDSPALNANLITSYLIPTLLARSTHAYLALAIDTLRTPLRLMVPEFARLALSMSLAARSVPPTV